MTDSKIELTAVEQAILQFYHNADGRQQAHTWLSQIQLSPAAWQFSWELLSLDKNQEVQFFGAATLQMKIIKFWYEVPEDEIPQLKSQLLEKLVEFSVGGRLIANKLCSALAGIILHTIGDDWKDAINDLISTFQSIANISDEVKCHLLLEIFSGLPDQHRHVHYGVRSGRRSAVHQQLMQNFPQIRQFMLGLFSESVPSSIKERALRCAASWTEFGVKIDENSSLIDKAFDCIRDDELFEVAVDTLIVAFTVNEPSKFPVTLQRYFSRILELSDLWQKNVEEENMEWSRDISRLVVNFGEENVQLILAFSMGDQQQRQLSMGIVNMIMMCTAVKGSYPADETLSDLPFGFWYILQDMALMADGDVYQHYMNVYRPVYTTLVEVLMRKVQYPENSVFEKLSSEEREQLRCYRQDISDTIMYANCFLREHLLALLRGYLSSLFVAMPDVRWQDVEAVFYIVSNVTEDCMAAEDEEEYDPRTGIKLPHTNSIFDDIMVDMVKLLTKMKFDNKIVLNSVLHCIGAFAEQYSAHPELLSIVFPVILLHGLNYSETALFATRALKDICRENRTSLSPFSDGILSVCHQILLQDRMATKNAARLLSCVGHVLSTLPYDDICSWLDKFLPPITESLGIAMASPPSSSVKVVVVDKLQMLTWLFDSLDVKKNENSGKSTQPVLMMTQELLPVIHNILTHWVQDSDVVQCVAELLKRTLNNLMDDFKPLLEQTCGLLTNMYSYLQHTCILDLVKQLVLIFSSDQESLPVIKLAFHSMANKTLEVLQNDPHAKTDLLESYQNLCTQMAKKSYHLISDPDFPMEQSLFAAVIGCSFPEAPTIKACCSFLAEVIMKKERYANLHASVQKLCLQLYDTLIKAIAGMAPRANLEYIAPVILALNISYFELACASINGLMSQENYPVPSVSSEDKHRFIKDVLRERTNKRRLKDTISNFSLICRGIAGTEYAQQTATSPFF